MKAKAKAKAPKAPKATRNKFKGGESVFIDANTVKYKVCKSGHKLDTHQNPRTYYKVTKGSDVRFIRSDRICKV